MTNQEVALRRKELKLEDKKLLLETTKAGLETAKDITVTVLSNPAVIYIGSYLFIKWLAQPKFDKEGVLVRNGYISGTIQEKLTNNLEAAFIAGVIASAAGKVVGVFK